MIMMNKIRVLILLFSLLVCQVSYADGIVMEINKAPVSSDGTTAGRTTDFVIDLDTALDPSVSGRTLLQGETIRITLPESFQNTENYPFFAAGPDCAPPLSGKQCNTAVLLQGWPQHPIAPPFMKYSFHYEAATNSVVYTALENLTPAAPLEPGIKQMHLLLLGFTNPHPGHYRVKVEAETGPAGAMETGWDKIHIIPKSRPSINVTSTGNDNSATLNTIYQTTTVENEVPLNYNFLLWDRNDVPFGDVDIADIDGSGNYLFKKGDKVVGHVSIEAPEGATGQMLTSFGSSFVTATPVFGPPSMTARWVAKFRAGSEPGRYTVTAKLNGGNEVNMFIDVTN
jgi:hypothetical protein